MTILCHISLIGVILFYIHNSVGDSIINICIFNFELYVLKCNYILVYNFTRIFICVAGGCGQQCCMGLACVQHGCQGVSVTNFLRQ